MLRQEYFEYLGNSSDELISQHKINNSRWEKSAFVSSFVYVWKLQMYFHLLRNGASQFVLKIKAILWSLFLSDGNFPLDIYLDSQENIMAF